MTANNKKPMTQAERQAFLGQTFTLREIFRILWNEKPAIYKNQTTGRFEDDGQQTLDNLEDRFRREAEAKLEAEAGAKTKATSLPQEKSPLKLVVTLNGRPVEDQAAGLRAFMEACFPAAKGS